MIVVMKYDATAKQIGGVIKRIEELGFKPHMSTGEKKTIVGMVGNGKKVDPDLFMALDGVDAVVPVLKPFKLASREFKSEPTIIDVNGFQIGGKQIAVMAGPCSVESLEQTMEAAVRVAKAGARFLRGGAFKPRSSPYAFQGLGEEGLKIMAKCREETGLSLVTEIMSPQHVDLLCKYTDIIQIGVRNMQNYSLLEAVGKTTIPVLLKRGLMSTIEEWLMSAEYILANGNPNVILCERGIRTFEKYTRNTLDIAAVSLVKNLSHLPVVVDPSHATGIRDLVGPMSRVGIAAGADGLIIEVHPEPDKALSDGAQSLYPDQFDDLMLSLNGIAEAMGRTI